MKPRSALRCLFIVQGEGRGHMTQALALRAMLMRAGHCVAGVMVGRSPRRHVPDFFLEKIDAPVTFIQSPNFATGNSGREIGKVSTVLQNTKRLGAYRESLGAIGTHLDGLRPHVVVNFFEPLAGIYYGLHAPSVPMVCMGHQYMFEHPTYRFPPGRRFDQWTMRQFTQLTALGASCKLALSYYPARDLPAERIVVVPPVLREGLFMQSIRHEPFLLVYVLNQGYADDILRWHEQHPDVQLHCFWDNTAAADVHVHDETLTFHRLDDEKFLSMMARCSGLVTTAGFESAAEAMYLGKPVLMVPVEGHFEQECNAIDAVRVGAGVADTHFDLQHLLDYLPRHRTTIPAFRPWAAQAEGRVIEAIEQAAAHCNAGGRAAA